MRATTATGARRAPVTWPRPRRASSARPTLCALGHEPGYAHQSAGGGCRDRARRAYSTTEHTRPYDKREPKLGDLSRHEGFYLDLADDRRRGQRSPARQRGRAARVPRRRPRLLGMASGGARTAAASPTGSSTRTACRPGPRSAAAVRPRGRLGADQRADPTRAETRATGCLSRRATTSTTKTRTIPGTRSSLVQAGAGRRSRRTRSSTARRTAMRPIPARSDLPRAVPHRRIARRSRCATRDQLPRVSGVAYLEAADRARRPSPGTATAGAWGAIGRGKVAGGRDRPAGAVALQARATCCARLRGRGRRRQRPSDRAERRLGRAGEHHAGSGGVARGLVDEDEAAGHAVASRRGRRTAAGRGAGARGRCRSARVARRRPSSSVFTSTRASIASTRAGTVRVVCLSR